MLALLQVPREHSRDPCFERPAKLYWDRLILSMAMGALILLIAVRVLSSLQSLCLPVQGKGKADPSSCSDSRTL